ncbi:hypothetical protein [Hyphomicrobium sp. 2TAF46]|uniref:hypothetical protein n=1 Tax=Hyphomicrobium sp. 2TAF46 TaxID=3233019 RepID=UPI003F90EDD0
MAIKTIRYLSTVEGAAVLAFLVAAAGSAIVFYYALGKDQGANACSSYTDAKKLNFEDMAKTTVAANTALKATADKFSELINQNQNYKQLSEENISLKKDNASKTAALASDEKEMAELREAVAKLTPQKPITIQANHAEMISGILVGMRPFLDDTVSVSANGRQYSLH